MVSGKKLSPFIYFSHSQFVYSLSSIEWSLIFLLISKDSSVTYQDPDICKHLVLEILYCLLHCFIFLIDIFDIYIY